MANWFDDFSANLLGSYRGKPIAPIDPTALGRFGSLKQEREAELAKLLGMSDQVRRESMIAEAMANRHSTAGGIMTNNVPSAANAINVLQDWGDRGAGVSKERIAGAERDEDRIAKYVDQSYNAAADREKMDYDRSRNSVLDARNATKFGWESEDRNRKEKFGLLDGEGVYQHPVTGEFHFLKDDSEVPSNRYGDVKGMVLADGKNRYQFGSTYVNRDTGERYTQVNDPQTGEAVFKDATGGVVTDRNVIRRLEPDTVTSSYNAGASKFAGEQGKSASEGLDKLRSQAGAAQGTIRTLDQLERVLQQTPTGQVAKLESYRALSGFLNQVAGFDLPAVDTTNMQVAEQQIKSLLMSAREGQRGLGPLTDQETAALEATLPQLGNSPQANKQIIDILRSAAQRPIEKNRAFMEGVKSGSIKYEDFNKFSDVYDYDSTGRPAANRTGASGATTRGDSASTDGPRGTGNIATDPEAVRIRRAVQAGEMTRDEAKQKLRALGY